MSFPELPSHLSAHQAGGLVRGETIAQFELGTHQNFVYLVTDWTSGHSMIVDPQTDLEPIREALRAHDLRLTGALLTHTHWDHVAGLPELLRLQPELEVIVGREDAHRIERKLPPGTRLRQVADGDVVPLRELRIRVMHTPGHSRGECCFLIDSTQPPYLLTGDTVFIRDCGRTDFPDSSTKQMFESLRRIAELPGPTVILPGHHYKPETASTVARELEENPAFRCRTVQELEAMP